LDNNRQCDINKFQLYTNVARFSDWVEEVTENGNAENFYENCGDRRDIGGLIYGGTKHSSEIATSSY
jgi:secreted trypsin-like serine protease